jgi:hypothetical protein
MPKFLASRLGGVRGLDAGRRDRLAAPRDRPAAASLGRRGTGKTEHEQTAREINGGGRGECAPRRTRERQQLGALRRLAGGRFLATPLYVGCRPSGTAIARW